MTTPLQDWQWELGGVRFGRRLPIDVTLFDRGGSDTRNQDQPSGFGDSNSFGVDRKTPGAWGFQLATMHTDGPSALTAVEELEGVWDAEDVRTRTGKVLPLRYCLFGRTRVVFGRPRRFTSPITTLLEVGLINVVADFQLAEPWSYDDVEQSVPLYVGAAETDPTSTTFPLTFPFMWGRSAGTPGSDTITVGGRRPTWLTAKFTAGDDWLTDPYVIVGGTVDGEPVGGAVLQLIGSIPPGENNAVIMSSLPWAQGVYRAVDGEPAPVYLAPGSRIAQMRVDPGDHLVTFGGIDPTGTATCDVSWRDAYNSI